jgi:hypothetical protein
MDQENTIILHTYNNLQEATIAIDKLKANGLNAYLQEENVMGLDPSGYRAEDYLKKTGGRRRDFSFLKCFLLFIKNRACNCRLYFLLYCTMDVILHCRL